MDVVLANNLAELGNCAHGADDGTAIVAGERNILDSLATLNGLSEPQLENDSADSVEVEVLDVPPTDEAQWVDFAVGPRDEAGAAQRGEHVKKR